MLNFIHKKSRGFSLIETLLAVAILMIAITRPLALVQSGLFSANHERNQITATYLAQEALEYIRSLRDANNYRQYGNPLVSWSADSANVPLFETCAASKNGCLVDPHGGLSDGAEKVTLKTWDPSNPNFIYKKTDNGTDTGNFVAYGYDQTNAVPTSF